MRTQQEFDFLANKFSLTPTLQYADWKYLRTRPQNFPHVRIRQIARLYHSGQAQMDALLNVHSVQELHERLRQHAIAAGKQVKEEGLPNDMVDRIAADPAFGLTKEEIVAGLVPENFVGRAPQQVEEFIANVLQPIFDANPDAVEQHASLSV